jgi:uncharacterized protein (UPF0262 family)
VVDGTRIGSRKTGDRSIVTPEPSPHPSNVLVDIRIHEPTWAAAARDRRREWALLIAELLDQHPKESERDLRLTITPGIVTVLGFETVDGGRHSEIVLPFDALRPHFREYCDICHRMGMLDEGSHSARLEALDMGKKLAHDRAAGALMMLCAPAFASHASARCLFSLLVSLHFDTAQMLGGHRVI